jgi:hypothetical protein
VRARRTGRRLARAAATVGLGALLSSRILPVLGMTSVTVEDQVLVPVWVDMMLALIGPGPG